MTLFRTQLTLKNTVTIFDIWKCFCEWTIASKRNRSAQLVEFCREHAETPDFFNEQFENGIHKEHLEILGNKNCKILGIIMTQFDRRGMTYVTSIVFNSETGTPLLSYETTVTGEGLQEPERKPFNKTKFFNYLSPFLPDDMNEGRFFSTDEMNIPILGEAMQGKGQVPFIYVSQYKDGSYPYTDDELNQLALNVYCSAVVIKEADPCTARHLRLASDSMNAYNGAVGIYVNGRRMIFFNKTLNQLSASLDRILCTVPLSEKVTVDYVRRNFIGQIENKIVEIVHNLFKPENFTDFLNGFNQALNEKQKKLEAPSESQSKLEQIKKDFEQQIETQKKEFEQQIEELKQRVEQQKEEQDKKLRENDELIRYYEDENAKDILEKQDLIEEVKRLSAENEAYKASFSKTSCKVNGYTVSVNCSERELFPNEIQDYLNGLIYERIKTFEKHPKTDREKHVAQVLLRENDNLEWEKTKTKARYDQIMADITEKAHSKEYSDPEGGGHHVVYFRGDKRYPLTEPSTPGDKRHALKNLADCAKTHHFLNPNQSR